jgi:hypothetical protein
LDTFRFIFVFIINKIKYSAFLLEQKFVSIGIVYFVFYVYFFEYVMSRDSSVGLARDYGLNGRGSISGRSKRSFFYFSASRPALGPVSHTVGTEVYISGGKAQGHEAKHSSPSRVEVKKDEAIPPLSKAFSCCSACLIKYSEHFGFILPPSGYPGGKFAGV